MTRMTRDRTVFTRRELLRQALGLAAAATCAPLGVAWADDAGGAPIAIGSRRELFVDDFLIARLTGAALRLHRPTPREVVLVCDRPWEGNTSAYFAISPDGDRFRMYYRGGHHDEKTKHGTHPAFTCYAESRDGRTWERPELGLFEFEGSRRNNIIWTGAGAHNFTPFRDANPAAAPDARYKAFASGTPTISGKQKPRLDAFKSPDGIHWTGLAPAVITAGTFDSQNLAFWDAERGVYRAYWRYFSHGDAGPGRRAGGLCRAIRTATSKDFSRWDHQADVRYEDSPPEHLYTNAVQPYFRAPHLLVGFPTRFRPKTEQVEPLFMSSRDGLLFRRWSEPLIPIDAPQDRGGNRSNYMTWGLVQLPGDDRELSVYATEAYYAGPGSRVRRFTFRTDGFVSVRAEGEGTLLTRLLTFTGRQLSLNLASRGPTRVELQDAGGTPLPGFALDDCLPLTGDFIEQTVRWKAGPDVGKLAGQPVRLRVALRDADLYALRFQ